MFSWELHYHGIRIWSSLCDEETNLKKLNIKKNQQQQQETNKQTDKQN